LLLHPFMLLGACIHEDSSGDLDAMACVLEATVETLDDAQVPHVRSGDTVDVRVLRRSGGELDVVLAS